MRAAQAHAMSTNRFLGMAALTAIVALLAAIAAAFGLFARGDGAFETVTSARGVTYEMATTGVYAFNAERVVAEGVGWDVFTLVIAVPALLVAAVFVARGSFRGRLFTIGLLGYVFYQYLEYAMTWAFGPLFPLFIAIYAASLGGIVWLGASITRDGVAGRFDERFPARRWSALVIGLSLLLTLMWVQRIAIGLGGDLEAAGIYGETTLVVQALDLGLMVPSGIVIGILAWRRTAAGRVLSAIFLVTYVAMALAISSMLVSAAIVEGSVELPPMVIFGGAALGAILTGIGMYRSGGAVAPRARIAAMPAAG
jgi:hypothetical protein